MFFRGEAAQVLKWITEWWSIPSVFGRHQIPNKKRPGKICPRALAIRCRTNFISLSLAAKRPRDGSQGRNPWIPSVNHPARTGRCAQIFNSYLCAPPARISLFRPVPGVFTPGYLPRSRFAADDKLEVCRTSLSFTNAVRDCHRHHRRRNRHHRRVRRRHGRHHRHTPRGHHHRRRRGHRDLRAVWLH